MNNLLKRLLSLTMAVVLVMSYAVMPVAADEGESGEHVHVYVEGVCECGTEEPAGEPTEAPTEHTHTYDEGTVTTEATCGASGVLTKTCGCGETVTETIAATGLHTYENGLCTVCTAADPDYVAPTQETEAPTEETRAVCDGTENCAAETHETTCDCYDWCAALGCTWEAHHADCPWGPCTLTEGCELVKNHPGECTGMSTFVGNGSVETPYQISNKEELFAFAEKINSGEEEYINKYTVLTADIDLEEDDWTSIGTSAHPFTGTFDGSGHTIFNLWCADGQNGLFGYTSNGHRSENLGYSATITNLTITNAVVTDNAQAHNGAGAAVGCGGMFTTISDVTVNGKIIITGNRAGGIVGYAYHGLDIDNCHVNGGNASTSKIQALNWAAGGIGGFISSTDSSSDVDNCSAKNITIEAVNHYGAAPIIGNCNDTDTITSVTAENVVVNGQYETDANYMLSCGTINGTSWAKNVTLTVGGAAITEPVDMIAVADGVYYPSLEAAVAAGGEVTLLKTVTVTAPINVTQSVTLNLNGKTINAAENGTAEDQAKHIYAISNAGTLTITGDGIINTRGIYNDGTMVLESGTVNILDADGGYIKNRAGTFTMNGGTITTTAEDTDAPAGAAYDPGAIHVEAGEVILNGGKIEGTHNWTYAVTLAGGRLTIPETSTVTVEGVSGAVAVKGGAATIGGGSFTCVNETARSSGHALYIKNGSVTVSGGNFTGYDEDSAFCKDRESTESTAVAITGGTFNSDVSAYVALGYKVTEEGGLYTVEEAAAEEIVQEVESGSAAVIIEENAAFSEDTAVAIEKQNDLIDNDTVAALLKAAPAEDMKAAVEELAEDPDTAGADLEFIIKLEPSEEKDGAGNVTSYKVDITPVLRAKDEEGKVIGEVEITEFDTPQNISFAVPFDSTYVNVKHTHGEDASAKTTNLGDKKPVDGVVTLPMDKFSEVEFAEVEGDSIVAKVGSAEFTSLESAIEEANGETITLLEDVYPASTLTIPSGKTVTIDLNGKSINPPPASTTSTAVNTIEVAGTLTVKDSNPSTSGVANSIHSMNGNVAPVAVKGGNFTLKSGELDGSMYGLRVEGGTANIQGGHIIVGLEDAYGVYVKEGTLNVTGGRIDGQYMGIAGNGMNDNTTINISGGSVGASKDNGIAIYHPQGGNLNISGGTICAATGVYVKGGTISVTGGTIEGIGAKNAYNGTGNGAYSTGDAMVVENRGGNYGPLKVAISAGTFTSTNAAPITSYAASDVNAVEKFVSGGTFSGKVEPDDALVQKEHFSFKQNSDGSYSIKEDPYVEVNGDRVYGSAESAPTLDSILDENANKAGEVSISLTQGGAIHQNHTMTGSVILDANNQPILGTGSISSQAGIEISDLSNSSVSMPDGGMADFNTDSVTYAPRYVSENGYGRVIVSKAGSTTKTYYYLDKGASLTVTDNGKVSVTGKYILGDKDEPYYTISIAQDGLYDNRHYLGKDGDMTVTCNGFYGSVDKIWITGEEYGKDKALPVFKEGAAVNGFKVVEGSTIVTLSEEYLDSLEKGDYQIHFQYKDHDDGEYISQVFKIRTKSSGNADTTNPKTGDTILMPMFIMTISAAALAVLLIDKKKRV